MHLQNDPSLSRVHRWQPRRKEFNAPDHVNPLVSCVRDGLGRRKQTSNTVLVTLLSVPSEMLSLEGEDFHAGEKRSSEEKGKGGSVVCGGKGNER